MFTAMSLMQPMQETRPVRNSVSATPVRPAAPAREEPQAHLPVRNQVRRVQPQKKDPEA